MLRADQALVLREQGWLATPVDVSVTVGAPAITVRWRDASQGETGFRVDLCPREGDCVEVGRSAAGLRSLVLPRPVWPAGTVFRARVQALGAVGQDSGYGVSAFAVVAAPPAGTPWISRP